MNQVLVRSMLRSRLMLVGVALFITAFVRVALEMQGQGEQLVAGYFVLYILVGTVFAGLLGQELGGPGPGGYGFLLARPVSRGRFLALRASLDVPLLTLLAIAVDLILDANGMKVWGPVLVGWLVVYSASSLGSSLGLSAIGATAAGLGLSFVSILLGAVAVYLGLECFNPLKLLQDVSFEQGVVLEGILHSFWQLLLPLLLPSLVLLGSGIAGAAAQLRRGSAPVRRTRVLLLGLAPSSAAALLSLLWTYGMSPRAGEAASISSWAWVVSYQTSTGTIVGDLTAFGRSRLRVENLEGQVVWAEYVPWMPFQGDRQGETVVLSDLRQLYVFDPGSSRPRTVELKKQVSPTGRYRTRPARSIFALSPDGLELVWGNTTTGCSRQPLIDGAPAVQIPNCPLQGQYYGWTHSGILLFLLESDDGFRMGRQRLDGTTLEPLFITERKEGRGRCDVVMTAADGTTLYRLSAKNQESEYGIVYPDGSRWVFPKVAESKSRLVGIHPDGRMLFAVQREAQVTEIYALAPEGEPTPLGQIHTGKWRLMTLTLASDGIRGTASLLDAPSGQWKACALIEGQLGELISVGAQGLFAGGEAAEVRTERGFLATPWPGRSSNPSSAQDKEVRYSGSPMSERGPLNVLIPLNSLPALQALPGASATEPEPVGNSDLQP